MIGRLVVLIPVDLLHVVRAARRRHGVITAILVAGHTKKRGTFVGLETVRSVSREVLISVVGFIVNKDPLVLDGDVTKTMVIEGQRIRELTMTIGERLMTFLSTEGDIRITRQMTEQRRESTSGRSSRDEKVIVRRDIHPPDTHSLVKEEIKDGGIRGPLDEDGGTSTQPSGSPLRVTLHRCRVHLALGDGITRWSGREPHAAHAVGRMTGHSALRSPPRNAHHSGGNTSKIKRPPK